MTGIFRRLQDEIEARDQNKGLSPIDLLDMPEALAKVINKIIRSNGMKLEDIATELGQSAEDTRATLDELVKKGLVRRIEVKEEVWYKAQFARKADKALSSNIWSALDGFVDDLEKK
jgi:predicted DNA-binding transcriptional regulator